jgi:hypothetical protein
MFPYAAQVSSPKTAMLTLSYNVLPYAACLDDTYRVVCMLKQVRRLLLRKPIRVHRSSCRCCCDRTSAQASHSVSPISPMHLLRPVEQSRAVHPMQCIVTHNCYIKVWPTGNCHVHRRLWVLPCYQQQQSHGYFQALPTAPSKQPAQTEGAGDVAMHCPVASVAHVLRRDLQLHVLKHEFAVFAEQPACSAVAPLHAIAPASCTKP